MFSLCRQAVVRSLPAAESARLMVVDVHRPVQGHVKDIKYGTIPANVRRESMSYRESEKKKERLPPLLTPQNHERFILLLLHLFFVSFSLSLTQLHRKHTQFSFLSIPNAQHLNDLLTVLK
jgi:hypothetical protein